MTVHDEIDVVAARTKVRDLARAVGLDTIDQARISLATSSSAHALGLGGTHRGQISVGCLRDGERTGVRVVCTKKTNAETCDLSPGTFDDMRRMVDELTVETLPSNGLRVTLVKWLARHEGEDYVHSRCR